MNTFPINYEDNPRFQLPSFWPFFGGVILMMLIMLGICKGCAQADTIDISTIIKIESGGNPLAYNRLSGAKGLMQITNLCLVDYNRANRAKIAPRSLFDPKTNIMVGKWYLNARIPVLLRSSGLPTTTTNTIWAYNAGIGNVAKSRIPKETKNYIQKYNRLTGKDKNVQR